MWRKTRSHYPAVNDTCYGVDGNRNFDILWNEFGVSSNPCADTYPGHEAFSEVETRYVRDILREYVPRIQIFMDHHSFGNYILFCYADTSLPENAAQIHQVGAAMGAQIDARKLPKAGYYRVGNSASVLYAASGASDDYAQVSLDDNDVVRRIKLKITVKHKRLQTIDIKILLLDLFVKFEDMDI